LTDTEQPSDVDATRNVRHFETELHTPGNAIWRPDWNRLCAGTSALDSLQ